MSLLLLPSFSFGASFPCVGGYDPTGTWLRDYGAAEPERYEQLLQYLAQKRKPAAPVSVSDQ